MYELIKKYEGFKEKAYKCPKGIWTIGYGSTFINGMPVCEGMSITKEKAENLLKEWIEKEVNPYISDLKLKGKQLDAVQSLVYNIGGPTFKKSKLREAIKNKDYMRICKEWDFGFALNLKGIIKRRIEELYTFIDGI